MPEDALRVLIVEDNQSWQQILTEILSEIGCVVDVASNYADAIQNLHAWSHRLAVVDLALGAGDVNNQDGLRVLDAVRRLDPGCVPILLTGYATVELAVSALTEYGAFSCLEKSAFNRAEFRNLVRKALASVPPADVSRNRESEDTGQVHTTSASSDGITEPSLLVVEDDAGWRGIIAEILTEEGFRTQLCSSYGEALGVLHRDNFALAVVDLNLDGAVTDPRSLWQTVGHPANLDGYQLLSGLRERGILAIVVSGIGVPDRISRTYDEQGIFAFLEKQTFNRQIFIDTVKLALEMYRQPSLLSDLTERELEVLNLLAQGETNKAIAEKLFISANTVKRHLKAIFTKLGVHTRAAAAAKAIQAYQS
jgi:DNA-binding NarL/FixJ family response regulator